jgi:predicted secreted Zn-dependent protease
MYDVPGNTLSEVATVIAAMAEAGKAEWWPELAYEGSDGLVCAVNVTVQQRKTMPYWQGYSDATQPMKDEWDRFWRALDAHEQGHFDLVRTHLENVDQLLVGQPVADVQRVFNDVVAALDAASSAYDAYTSHGLNQGTSIDLDAEAAPSQ